MNARRRSRARRDTAGGTNESMPFHMWKSAVLDEAYRKGARFEAAALSERVRHVLHRAYHHGEPIWMAADELATIMKAEARPLMREPREELRRAVAAYYVPKRDAGHRSRSRRDDARKLTRAQRSAINKAAFAAQRARELSRRSTTSRKERRSESDDEVVGNIPAHLRPLWDRVKGGISGSARKSRTEAFMQYVEENPRERFAHADDATDRLVADLERQQRAGRRDRRRLSRR